MRIFYSEIVPVNEEHRRGPVANIKRVTNVKKRANVFIGATREAVSVILVDSYLRGQGPQTQSRGTSAKRFKDTKLVKSV